MNVEQIIKQSRVTGTVPNMLLDIPFDNVPNVVNLLGQIISPIFGEERYNDVYRIKTIMGFVGREEDSNDFRIVWRREFPEPLPQLESMKDYLYNPGETFFGFILNGMQYNFHKADGHYIGCTKVSGKYEA